MASKGKIRRLCPTDETSSSNKTGKFLLFLIGIICGLILYHPQLITDFIRNYEEQYNLLVHGQKDYCSKMLNVHDVIMKIKEEILHQDLAMKTFENFLSNHSKFTAITVIGTTGVGKTLFSHLLLKNFPWKDNTQYFSWSIYGDQRTKDLLTSKLLRRMSLCGQNIIVIDNLRTTDITFAETFNKKAENKIIFGYKLIIIYIFKIPSFVENAEIAYKNNLHYIANLTNSNLIRFRSFNQSDLRECITHEAKNLHISLNDKEILKIENSIEASRSGCKTVYSKVVILS